MYLLNLSYIKPLAQVEPQMKPHGEWVTRHLQAGTFLFAGPKKSGLGGVIATKSMEKEQLMKLISEDCYVEHDVAEYQIVDFECKLAQSGLEVLQRA